MSEYIRKMEVIGKYESEDADLPESVGIGDHDHINIIQGLHLLYGAIGSIVETFIHAACDVKTSGLHHTVSERLAEQYTTNASKVLAEQFVQMLKHLEGETEHLEEFDLDNWMEQEGLQ